MNSSLYLLTVTRSRPGCHTLFASRKQPHHAETAREEWKGGWKWCASNLGCQTCAEGRLSLCSYNGLTNDIGATSCGVINRVYDCKNAGVTLKTYKRWEAGTARCYSTALGKRISDSYTDEGGILTVDSAEGRTRKPNLVKA